MHINTNNYDNIVHSVKEILMSVYVINEIKCGFITGSIPAGKSKSDSDIDIFICYKDNIDNAKTKKISMEGFYFSLHKEFRRQPDDISPGEFLSYSQLSSAIDYIELIKPSKILNDRNSFDAICWAGMLISKQYKLFEPDEDIHELINRSRLICLRWVDELELSSSPTEATGEYTDLDKLLRMNISSPGYYDAH